MSTELQPLYPLVDLDPHPSVLWADPQANLAAIEQYRVLRTRILQHPLKPRVIVVGSPWAGDGKSTTAINLAGMLALRKSRVILVDCDLRRSSLAKALGLSRQMPGLVSVLNGGALTEAVVRPRILPELAILLAGPCRINPVELFDSPPWPALVEQLRAEFDYVICDGPPIAGLADYALIQKPADSALLVVRPNHSKRPAIAAAVEIIDPEKFLGVVVNQHVDWLLYRSKSYYGYYGDYGRYGGTVEGKEGSKET